MPLEREVTAPPENAAFDRTATAAGAPARAPGSALEPGDLLAHYRIDRRLGAGGMGEVWLATDLALDRPVAIKVLPPDVARDASRRERLVREARAQARIQHPNVCHIYFVGEERGLVFFAMEHIAGESLAERVARGPIPADQAVELVRMAALGLREAHRHGFTHRDVKPSNLMVDAHGQVKVVDFGLVTRGEPAGDRDEDDDVARTALVGTPLYMAPEQARGDTVDFRADVYALGATLHHLVSGRPPFEGKTAADLISQHADSQRPPLTAAPGGRRLAPLDEILARMMAKRAGDRYETYDALVADLERISPVRTRPAGLFARACAATVDLALILAISFVVKTIVGRLEDSVVIIAVVAAYAIAFDSRWGVTPGRWLFDIEVVASSTGKPPSVRTAAVRWLVQCGPLAAGVVTGALSHSDVPFADPIGTAVSVLGCIYAGGALCYAALRDPAKRATWDRVAGTQVRYRRAAV